MTPEAWSQTDNLADFEDRRSRPLKTEKSSEMDSCHTSGKKYSPANTLILAQ